METGDARLRRLHWPTGSWCLRASSGLALLVFATGLHAGPVYKCLDAHGAVAFQDTPCAARSAQAKLDVTGQPLIDPDAPSAVSLARKGRTTAARSRASGGRASAARTKSAKPVMSWECRAADGEVFYRHTRCPSSLPGDGVARWADGNGVSGARSRRGRGAWAPVPVRGTRITREQACRRINATATAGRDGHERDEKVSAYDHSMGRDPCRGY